MATQPPFKMGGPPPGTTPQGLSSMLPQGGGAAAMGGLGEAKPEGGSGGLKDVFDEVQGVLDALASILPEHAEELDNIKLQLSEVLAKAISGGASFQGATGGGMQSPANPGLPV